MGLFTRKNKRKEAARREAAVVLRRIIDRTVSVEARLHENRSESRYNRMFGVLIAPWCPKDGPNLEKSGLGITRDLSDHGCSLLSGVELEGDVVLTFLVDDEVISTVHCFHGMLRRNRKLLEGMHEYGVEFVADLSSEYREKLVDFVLATNDAFDKFSLP